MHLTLKQETTRPPAMNAIAQQDRFDTFVSEFNNQRPHEALDMKCLAAVYTPRHRAPLPACRSSNTRSTTAMSW
jgi:hypothetical protein